MLRLPTALILMSLSAFADEVVLRNGARFSGDVREENDRVVIRFEFGTMSFHRSEVSVIRSGPDPLRDLDALTSNASTAQDWHDAAVFARSRKLETRVEALHLRALELDPEHEGSRTALGYAKVEGRWLKGDDLFRALGYVKWGAHWVTKETAAKLEAEAAAARAREEETARAKAAAEAEARVAGELEAARLALERERLELERARLAAAAERRAVLALPGYAPRWPVPIDPHGGAACPAAPCSCGGGYYVVERVGSGPPIKGPRR